MQDGQEVNHLFKYATSCKSIKLAILVASLQNNPFKQCGTWLRFLLVRIIFVFLFVLYLKVELSKSNIGKPII